MCKSEIFAKIINIVSKETEVPVDQILSSDKNMETVDARYLLVSLLSESGMYPSQIAVHIHKTKRAVNYMISNFYERMESGKMLRIYWDNIKKSLGNNWFYISYNICTFAYGQFWPGYKIQILMERTYVFGDPSGNGGAANNLLASILPSLQNRGIDTCLLYTSDAADEL